MADHFGVYAIIESDDLFKCLSITNITGILNDFKDMNIKSVNILIEIETHGNQAAVEASIAAKGGKIVGRITGNDYSIYGPKGKPPGSTDAL